MEKKILEILTKVPQFNTETCSGESYHGSSKGDKREFTVYKYSGQRFYSLDDAKVAFVLNELGKEVKEFIKNLKTNNYARYNNV
jgi:hypothetical protein